MKIGDIVANRNAIPFAYRINVKNGARAFAIVDLLEEMEKELEKYDKVKDGVIKATGKTAISSEDPEWPDVVTKLNEVMEVEVDIKITPLLERSEIFEATDVSAAVVAGLRRLGLMNANEPASSAPAAPAPTPTAPDGEKQEPR